MRTNCPHPLVFESEQQPFEQWYPREMVIMLGDVDKVGEDVTNKVVEV